MPADIYIYIYAMLGELSNVDVYSDAMRGELRGLYLGDPEAVHMQTLADSGCSL
jgi:hypothetical protein